MKSFNISKRRYDNLTKVVLPDNVISTEADFYRLNYMGQNMIFKSLHRTKGTTFANKLYILEMLDNYKDILPSNFVIPNSLVTVEKQIQGFVLPFVSGDNLENFLANKNVDIKDKIYYLKQIGIILNKLDKVRKETYLDSIYLNDLHASNFIVDQKNKKLKVVDLDSCKICDSKPAPARHLLPLSLLNEAPGDNKYDVYRKELINDDGVLVMSLSDYYDKEDYNYGTDYCRQYNYRDELGFINSNEASDLYCYCIVVLNFLYGANMGCFGLSKFYDYMLYLEKIGVNQNLINAFIKIVTNAPNENIGEYLDTLTEQQIYKARRPVFEAVTMNVKR